MGKALANTLAVFGILERIAKGHRKAIPRFSCIDTNVYSGNELIKFA